MLLYSLGCPYLRGFGLLTGTEGNQFSELQGVAGPVGDFCLLVAIWYGNKARRFEECILYGKNEVSSVPRCLQCGGTRRFHSGLLKLLLGFDLFY